MAGYEIVVVGTGVSAAAAFIFAKVRKGNTGHPRKYKKKHRQHGQKFVYFFH